MNSAPGVADGEFSAWFNGEHVVEKNNIEWAGPNATFSTWNYLYFATHWDGGDDSFATTKEERKQFDVFAIGLTPLNLFSAGRGAVAAATSSNKSATSSSSNISEDFSALTAIDSLRLGRANSALAPLAVEEEFASPIVALQLILDQAYEGLSPQSEEIYFLFLSTQDEVDQLLEELFAKLCWPMSHESNQEC